MAKRNVRSTTVKLPRSYKGRLVNLRRPVEVYRNLQGDGITYSVRQSGLVVAHVQSIALDFVQFLVQPAGPKRVRRDGRKYVHAWVRGYVSSRKPKAVGKRVSYDPYVQLTFECGGKPIFECERVSITESGVFVER